MLDTEYLRVLPRDAFNEANLLKCIAKLTMLIEDKIINNMTFDYDGSPFEIGMYQADGSISIKNIHFYNEHKELILLSRPINSRQAWPLYDAYDNQVFDDNGNYIYKQHPLDKIIKKQASYYNMTVRQHGKMMNRMAEIVENTELDS